MGNVWNKNEKDLFNEVSIKIKVKERERMAKGRIHNWRTGEKSLVI